MAPMGFWEKKRNIKSYLDWLFEKLRYKKMDDWYQINTDLFEKNSESGLLAQFPKSSIYELLKYTYPKHNWYPWLFKVAHQGIWKDKKNHRLFLEWVIKKEKMSFKNDSIYKLTHVNAWSLNFQLTEFLLEINISTFHISMVKNQKLGCKSIMDLLKGLTITFVLFVNASNAQSEDSRGNNFDLFDVI